MFKRLALALTITLAPMPALAQTAYLTGVGPQDNNPQPEKLQCWNGTAWAACSASNPLYVSGGGGGGGNAAAGTIGSAAPSSASYTGYIGADGNLHGWLGDNTGHPYVTIYGAIPAGTNAIGSITNTGFASFGSAGTAFQQGTGAAGANSQNVYIGGQYSPVNVNGKQESFQLANSNTASSAATTFGGDYIFGQQCTSYNSGSLVLSVLGSDGATYQSILSKTASDTTGGTGIALGSNAIVKVTLPSGSTGCYALLSRVPN